LFRSIKELTTGAYVYDYKRASLCRNEQSTMRGSNTAIIRTTNLPGQYDGNLPPIDVAVLQRPKAAHQAIVGSVVKELTSPAVKQWHTNVLSLIGVNGTENWTRHDAVEFEPHLSHLSGALDDFSRGTFLARNGVRVVNLSIGTNVAFSTPCDNNDFIIRDTDLFDIQSSINRLKGQGVSVVTSTRNHIGGIDEDSECLSRRACQERLLLRLSIAQTK
jgi:hypothetical protein